MKQQFERFDLSDAENLRVRIPQKTKRDVEDFFYDYIQYQSGITLKDAYLHCTVIALKAYKEDSKLFYKHLKVIEEEEKSKESLMLLPKTISTGVSHIKDGLGLKNKRQAFLSAIGIGLILLKGGA